MRNDRMHANSAGHSRSTVRGYFTTAQNSGENGSGYAKINRKERIAGFALIICTHTKCVDTAGMRC